MQISVFKTNCFGNGGARVRLCKYEYTNIPILFLAILAHIENWYPQSEHVWVTPKETCCGSKCCVPCSMKERIGKWHTSYCHSRMAKHSLETTRSDRAKKKPTHTQHQSMADPGRVCQMSPLQWRNIRFGPISNAFLVDGARLDSRYVCAMFFFRSISVVRVWWVSSGYVYSLVLLFNSLSNCHANASDFLISMNNKDLLHCQIILIFI